MPPLLLQERFRRLKLFNDFKRVRVKTIGAYIITAKIVKGTSSAHKVVEKTLASAIWPKGQRIINEIRAQFLQLYIPYPQTPKIKAIKNAKIGMSIALTDFAPEPKTLNIRPVSIAVQSNMLYALAMNMFVLFPFFMSNF